MQLLLRQINQKQRFFHNVGLASRLSSIISVFGGERWHLLPFDLWERRDACAALRLFRLSIEPPVIHGLQQVGRSGSQFRPYFWVVFESPAEFVIGQLLLRQHKRSDEIATEDGADLREQHSILLVLAERFQR